MPHTLISIKDNKLIPLIKDYKNQWNAIKLNGGIHVNVLHTESLFDVYDYDVYTQQELIRNTVSYFASVCTINGDWDAWNNGTFGAKALQHLFKTTVISRTTKYI